MKHENPTYIRKGKTITNVKTNESEKFKSISAAKRKSREIQMANKGTLGNGYLRVQH